MESNEETIQQETEENQTPSMLRYFTRSKYVSKYLLRLLVRTMATILAALVFGFAFAIIVQGAIITLYLLATFWEPAFRFIAWFVSLEERVDAYIPLRVKWWQAPVWILQITIFSMLIAAGIWILIQQGFCSQSLLCQLFK